MNNEKILQFLRIVLIRESKKGKYKRKEYKLNAFNPLTYIWILLMAIVGIFWEGFPRIIKELKTIKREFKWR